MARYLIWALLGALAIGSMFLPSTPDARAAAPTVADMSSMTLTLTQ